MSKLSIQHNIDLKTFNTFGVSAKARYFISVHELQDLQALTQLAEYQAHPRFILGGGSNILFMNDYDGLVIKNEIKGIEKIHEDAETVTLKIGAGENWHQVVMQCIEQGWGGIENLSLIAGTVGAAPIQNIGAYGAELKDVFQELEAIRVSDGEFAIFDHATCEFGYRNSVFKNKFKDQYIIATVSLRLHKNPKFNISYDALQKKLQDKNPNELNIKMISDAVIAIRQSKLPDPNVIGNAGSFFKNPVISEAEFLALQQNHPKIPHYFEGNNAIKIAAGWLIEQCGWKGKRFGDAGVHRDQALVIVNYGAATGSQIYDLAMQIQKSVAEHFGIHIEPEVNLISS